MLYVLFYIIRVSTGFVPVPDRRASTLIPPIEQYVEEGSRIITDKWSSYQQLETHSDYSFSSVNHTYNFVTPEDPTVHTNNVECMWHHAKIKLGRQCGTSDDYFNSYLFEFMWRRRNPVKCFNNILITIQNCSNVQ